ncbi:hypothetical protein FE257_007654 [Aspergillus nanangensis]|uniref:Uncharacterized protein n=1 Tax=Aspergillus nanangensis TaxID=2582783 RepID=A0AAD4GU06_ASPNN|nr:hypothetical protein FE257_007654 [Aspergillus nanangensis]
MRTSNIINTVLGLSTLTAAVKRIKLRAVDTDGREMIINIPLNMGCQRTGLERQDASRNAPLNIRYAEKDYRDRIFSTVEAYWYDGNIWCEINENERCAGCGETIEMGDEIDWEGPILGAACYSWGRV